MDNSFNCDRFFSLVSQINNFSHLPDHQQFNHISSDFASKSSGYSLDEKTLVGKN
jgi:hypothetical protein